MRAKKLLLTLAACGTLALGGLATAPTAGAANAEPAPTLKSLCTERHGDFYVTPYQKARCQNAHRGGDRTFSAEKAICENELVGTFSVVPSFSMPNWFTWACI